MIAIAKPLQQEPHVTDVLLERPLGILRPDVSAVVNGVSSPSRSQISSLSGETTMRWTIEYRRKGIYVLSFLQWTLKLDSKRYFLEIREKMDSCCMFDSCLLLAPRSDRRFIQHRAKSQISSKELLLFQNWSKNIGMRLHLEVETASHDVRRRTSLRWGSLSRDFGIVRREGRLP
jgi:hypothetical protein